MQVWIRLIFGFSLLSSAGANVWAEDLSSESGMITIEVVENPSFFELYGNYVYLALIVFFLGIFFWRRHTQGKGKA